MKSPVIPLRRITRGIGTVAADFLYPPACVRCGAAITSAPDNEQGGVARFCADCHELLRCRIERACLVCGAPVGPYLATPAGCQHCRGDDFAFERVFTLGVYEAELKRACLRIKEPFQDSLAAGLTELLADAWEEVLAAAEVDVIVPVPHHWIERLARRHRPPLTMGRVLARRLKVPCSTHILTKARRTPAQSSLPLSRRRTNLRWAFCTSGGVRLDGTTVLLADDILTTGTTAEHAARALRRAGADRVLVAVLARGIGQSPTHRG